MKKIFLPGLVSAIAMIAASMVFGFLLKLIFPGLNDSFMAEYENTSVFRPMKDPLMMLFFLHPFLYSFPIAWGWDKIKDRVAGGVWLRAWYVMLFLFFLSTLPGMFISYTCFVVSLPMIISWLASSVFQTYAGALVICSMNK